MFLFALMPFANVLVAYVPFSSVAGCLYSGCANVTVTV